VQALRVQVAADAAVEQGLHLGPAVAGALHMDVRRHQGGGSVMELELKGFGDQPVCPVHIEQVAHHLEVVGREGKSRPRITLVLPVLQVEGLRLQTRVLVTATLSVTDLLDLRNTGTRAQLGLTLDVLQSGTQDRQAYQGCQQVAQVAQVAHQLGRHGVLAPAAGQRGETLALVTDNLPAANGRTVPNKTSCGHAYHPIPANPPPGPYGSCGTADTCHRPVDLPRPDRPPPPQQQAGLRR